jgi:hypothetical protein
MIVKKVNRYYCEYCEKSGGSAGHMRHHEERCTANPNRECGCCTNLLEQEQPILSEIMALLPTFPEGWKDSDYDTESALRSELARIFSAIQEAAKDCPVCIMAALRQKGIPPSFAEAFDYKAMLANCWDWFNERHSKYEI